jgi:hypothetical protein
MIVFASPVGNVARHGKDTSCRHGKDPSDDRRAVFKADFRRPANDIKADFYPARQCSFERSDGGKRASPNDAINATEQAGRGDRGTRHDSNSSSGSRNATIGLMH